MGLPRQQINVELANGDVFELEIINPDRIRFETERTKWGLPSLEDGAFTYMTFLAWAALKRLGKYEGDWPTFKTADCVLLDPVDDEEAGEVPPTAQETAAGSGSV
jgi:hypothetical protein